MGFCESAFFGGCTHFGEVCVLHGAIHRTWCGKHCEERPMPVLQLQCTGATICTQKVVARDKIKTVQCQKTFPPQRYGHSRWGKEFHEKMVLLFVVLQDDDINAVPDRGVCKQKKG